MGSREVGQLEHGCKMNTIVQYKWAWFVILKKKIPACKVDLTPSKKFCLCPCTYRSSGDQSRKGKGLNRKYIWEFRPGDQSREGKGSPL